MGHSHVRGKNLLFNILVLAVLWSFVNLYAYVAR